MIKKWFKTGDPWIWLNAAAVSASLIIVLGLLALIAVKGLSHFWPKSVMQVQYLQATTDSNAKPASIRIIGEVHNDEEVSLENLKAMGVNLDVDTLSVTRLLVKTGNRDVSGADFKWILQPYIKDEQYHEDIIVLERREWGNFYGYLKSVKSNGNTVALADTAWQELEKRMDRAELIYEQIRDIEKGVIGSVNYKMEKIRLNKRRLELDKEDTKENLEKLQVKQQQLEKDYAVLEKDLAKLYKQIKRDSITTETMSGKIIEIPLAKIVRAYQPNALSVMGKISLYFQKIW